MLIEMGPIEIDEAVDVIGEMGRNPVEYNPNASAVQGVDEEHEILRAAVARSRCKVSHCLISPGTVEGVLHERRKLDMGKAHGLYVFRQIRCHLTVGERAVILLRHPPPGAGMEFVHGNRSIQRVKFPALPHPFGVFPIIGQVADYRCRLGRGLP